MDDFTFYKEIFEREQIRRLDLDNAINIPIGAISILTGLIIYVFDNSNSCNPCIDLINKILITGYFISTVVMILFMAKSYNNFFRGNGYDDIPYARDLRNYQLRIDEYNLKSDDKDDFNKYLIEKFVNYADLLMKVNDKRAKALYISKTFLIISLIITLFTIMFHFLLKLFV